MVVRSFFLFLFKWSSQPSVFCIVSPQMNLPEFKVPFWNVFIAFFYLFCTLDVLESVCNSIVIAMCDKVRSFLFVNKFMRRVSYTFFTNFFFISCFRSFQKIVVCWQGQLLHCCLTYSKMISPYQTTFIILSTC